MQQEKLFDFSPVAAPETTVFITVYEDFDGTEFLFFCTLSQSLYAELYAAAQKCDVEIGMFGAKFPGKWKNNT